MTVHYRVEANQTSNCYKVHSAIKRGDPYFPRAFATHGGRPSLLLEALSSILEHPLAVRTPPTNEFSLVPDRIQSDNSATVNNY